MNPRRLILLCTAAVSLAAVLPATPVHAATLEELRDSEVATALRQALEVGAGNAINRIGQENGFLNNAKIRIPMPESLQKVEKGMRAVGMGKQADELVTTMNRAAEQAVPEARQLLLNTVRTLTIQDAKTILTGPEDAATSFFRDRTQEELTRRFLPIVGRATKRLKLAEVYNKFAGRGVAFGLIRSQDANLDSYVTQKALDGLFSTLAEEEKAIRANPIDAGKKLVQKVFGAILPQ
ncbi:MAG: DUF4197 domain-containing protein [Burkholderiales bacterium]